MNLHRAMAVLLVAAASLLSSCGGGGGSDSAVPSVSNSSSSLVLASSSSSSNSSVLASSSSSVNSSGQGLMLGGAIQGKPLTLANTVTTFAGAVIGSDGIGASANFQRPIDSVVVNGDLFVSDSSTIRKIVIATGAVTTLAGKAGSYDHLDGIGTAARFIEPHGITTDGTNLFVAETDTSSIRKIVIATGAVTTLAGAGYSGTVDGIGTEARFNQPSGITSDGTNLFVTDSINCTIRKIVIATGEVTTLAGSATFAGRNDGIGTAARFNNPHGITTDGINLFVTDLNNGAIRKIVIASGLVTTLAVTVGDYTNIRGIATDGTSLFVTDYYKNTVLKIVIATGAVTTIAGHLGDTIDSSDGIGTAAGFYFPFGITTDGANLFVADSYNRSIRKIVIATGAVTTLAGTASGNYGSSDGMGTAARFNQPYGIATDGTNLFVADNLDNVIRKIVIASGVVTTLAGSPGYKPVGGDDGTGTAARFHEPNGITTDGTNLFVADTNSRTIRRIVIASGAVTTLAGSYYYTSSNDGTGTAASFHSPQGITTDGTNLFVTDTFNGTIRKIVIASGVVTTIAGNADSPQGSSDGTGTEARFNQPSGITFDGANLFVTDSLNCTIRKIVIASGVVTTLAGASGSCGDSDGTGTAASFNYPRGITTDGTNLFITDTDNHTIRKIVIASGVVTTLAGTIGSYGKSDGSGTAASFHQPNGITTDGTNLFVADSVNGTIRKIE